MSFLKDTVKCDECPTQVVWDQVHRIEIAGGKEKNLCADCCPNCFVQPTQRIETIP